MGGFGMRAVRGLVVVALLGLLPVAGCVKKGTPENGEEKATYTLTKKAYTHLLKTREHVEKKEYKEAFEELDEMAERKASSS